MARLTAQERGTCRWLDGSHTSRRTDWPSVFEPAFSMQAALCRAAYHDTQIWRRAGGWARLLAAIPARAAKEGGRAGINHVVALSLDLLDLLLPPDSEHGPPLAPPSLVTYRPGKHVSPPPASSQQCRVAAKVGLAHLSARTSRDPPHQSWPRSCRRKCPSATARRQRGQHEPAREEWNLSLLACSLGGYLPPSALHSFPR